MSTEKLSRTSLHEKVALAWCTEENKNKIMDPELAEAFVNILAELVLEMDKECKKPRLGYATNEELLREMFDRVKADGKLSYIGKTD